MTTITRLFLSILILCSVSEVIQAQKFKAFMPGEIWNDDRGYHINAHGGGMLIHQGKYYWFGEHKGKENNAAWVGVTCYSSDNLYDWKYESVALAVDENKDSEIAAGCLIERPKVIYNESTGKFVMYFHLELKDKGYTAARVGIATSDKVEGPYTYIRSCRPNAGVWPMDMTEEQRISTLVPEDFDKWWTEEWKEAVVNGLFVRRDFEGGQMSRDMTLYVDDDGKAYHIYASEENLTLHIAELSDDYLSHSGRYVRVAPTGLNEAPAIFKRNGKYFMITSGCTGWAPNAARLHSAESIWGPWIEHPNPCVGEHAETTFYSQSTFIFPVQGVDDAFIFMADRWQPQYPVNGRYIWLPIEFDKEGLPVLKPYSYWNLNLFVPCDGDGVCEVMPQYKGGYKKLYEWLGKNLQYPYEAIKDGASGVVKVKFKINKNGKVDTQAVMIIEGSGHLSLDMEAVRVIRKLPRFTPGLREGEPVDVWFTIPILFR